MRKTTASIMTPAHAVSLDVALSSLFPHERVSCTIFFQWPGLSEIQSELRNVFEKMLATSPHRYRFVANIDEVKNQHATHFFYAHDVSTPTVHEICAQTPHVKRVCLGDALGMVCDRKYHLGLILSGLKPNSFEMLRRKIQRVFKLLFYRRQIDQAESIVPDLASLIIPVDQTGTSLLGVELHIPPKSLVLETLRRMSDSFSELRAFVAETISDPGNANVAMVLLENIAEGGTMSFENEIQMYVAMVRESVAPGSTVILKGHPGETLDRYTPIEQMLGSDYRVVNVANRFKRIPIELWLDLIEKAQFISLSYPTLSLDYLFDKKVVNPATETFLEKWVEPKYWESYKDGLKLYKIPLDRLPKWNRKSVLASGPL